jgi:hypothetical protein
MKIIIKYSTECLSVLAEVSKTSFKTHRVPFDHNKYKETDLSRSINRSSDMSKLNIKNRDQS